MTRKKKNRANLRQVVLSLKLSQIRGDVRLAERLKERLGGSGVKDSIVVNVVKRVEQRRRHVARLARVRGGNKVEGLGGDARGNGQHIRVGHKVDKGLHACGDRVVQVAENLVLGVLNGSVSDVFGAQHALQLGNGGGDAHKLSVGRLLGLCGRDAVLLEKGEEAALGGVVAKALSGLCKGEILSVLGRAGSGHCEQQRVAVRGGVFFERHAQHHRVHGGGRGASPARPVARVERRGLHKSGSHTDTHKQQKPEQRKKRREEKRREEKRREEKRREEKRREEESKEDEEEKKQGKKQWEEKGKKRKRKKEGKREGKREKNKKREGKRERKERRSKREREREKEERRTKRERGRGDEQKNRSRDTKNRARSRRAEKTWRCAEASASRRAPALAHASHQREVFFEKKKNKKQKQKQN